MSSRRSPPRAVRVRIGGEEWTARAYDETLVIPAGTTVDVIEIERRHRTRLPAGVNHGSISAFLVAGLIVALFAVFTVLRAVRIVPQARARNVERLGRYRRTLKPGLNFVIPYIDRVYPVIDLREQVVSFQPQPVITEDNLVVEIDTVLYFQVTDPRAAAYEIASYLQAVEQLTVTTLRNVVGSMDLEKTLTSRDTINSQLRGVLDEATGKWGLRVNRVEIKAIDPPKTIKDAMEKQMRAERDKRAAILGAEGQRQSQILTAEGDKQGAVLRAEGNRSAEILKAEGESQAIDRGLPGRAPQRPGPQTACLPVPADAASARRRRGQHVLGDPQRGHLRAEGVSRAFTEVLPRVRLPPARSPRRTTVQPGRGRHCTAAEAAAQALADAAEADSTSGNIPPRPPLRKRVNPAGSPGLSTSERVHRGLRDNGAAFEASCASMPRSWGERSRSARSRRSEAGLSAVLFRPPPIEQKREPRVVDPHFAKHRYELSTRIPAESGHGRRPDKDSGGDMEPEMDDERALAEIERCLARDDPELAARITALNEQFPLACVHARPR